MQQFAAMLGRTADGALVLDQDGKVRFWNRAAERLLGFQPDEVLARPCHEVMRRQTLGAHPRVQALLIAFPPGVRPS